MPSPGLVDEPLESGVSAQRLLSDSEVGHPPQILPGRLILRIQDQEIVEAANRLGPFLYRSSPEKKAPGLGLETSCIGKSSSNPNEIAGSPSPRKTLGSHGPG
jgi:hypothetical protein